MKTVACVLLVVCLGAMAAHGRDLLDEPFDFSKYGGSENGAFAGASATSRGGTAVAKSISKSSAKSKAKNAVVKITTKAIKEVLGGKEATAVATGYGYAVGEAIAEAYTKTFVYTKTTGNSKACGSGYASAKAAATTYASVFVEALAVAANQNKVAVGHVDATAIASATASAYAEAESYACSEGNAESHTVSENYAKATATVYAEAFVAAYGKVKGTTSSAGVHTEAKSRTKEKNVAGSNTHSGSRGVAHGESRGGAEASVHELPTCEGRFARCCHRRFYGYRRTCRCGRGCAARRQKQFSTGAIYRLAYYRGGDYERGYQCQC